jgi:hypothetical protein
MPDLLGECERVTCENDARGPFSLNCIVSVDRFAVCYALALALALAVAGA